MSEAEYTYWSVETSHLVKKYRWVSLPHTHTHTHRVSGQYVLSAFGILVILFFLYTEIFTIPNFITDIILK